VTAIAPIAPQLVLERARDYVRRGFSVIPLQVAGKKPLVGWAEYQTRRPTDDELRDWFAEDNTFGLVGTPNIGIVTGAISGVDVIDCDSREAVDLATKHGIGTVPTVKTGRGFHFYFAHADGVRNFQKRDDLPGIDLRADGGYVVAPPSVHESGVIYRWEGEDRTLSPLPGWILADVQTSAQVVKMPVTTLYTGVDEGSRNQSLARLVGSWASSMPIEFALPAALYWGRNLCRPSMDDREIERTVRSIYAKEGSKRAEIANAGWSSEPEVEVADSSEIVTVADLLDDVEHMYTHGLQPGVTTGWASLDGEDDHDRIYSVRKGEWTLITGIPGHGKSSWLDQLMIQLAEQHGWKFAVFSAENRPTQRHVVSLLEKFIDKPFREGPTARITRDDMRAALPWLNEHFFFLEPNEESQNLRTLLSLGDRLIAEQQISALIIDPWNELDHSRPNGQTETEYISIALSAIRRFARARQIHVFVVAHPAKMMKENGKYPVPTPYDVSGSAHWRNKADNAIAVHRDPVVEGERPSNSIHVQKIRFRENGRIGVANLTYDNITGRFEDTPWRPR
jgi:replicative DNA helicase